MTAPTLSKQQIDEALADLDRLSDKEYGYGLDELLNDPDHKLADLRLQRLTGILIKRSFAHSLPIGAAPTETKSRRAWKWDLDKFSDPRLAETPEYKVLDELRREMNQSEHEATFQQLTDEAEHERGLFKVLALWVSDKLKHEKGKSFKDYFEAEESPRFEAVLDVSTTVFQAAIAPVLAPFLPIPGVVVSLILIGVRFGYRSLTDIADLGDNRS
jgi:hypothetical protein